MSSGEVDGKLKGYPLVESLVEYGGAKIGSSNGR